MTAFHDNFLAFASGAEGFAPLLATYNQLETAGAAFKSQSGLDCPAGCRHCCAVPAARVEASLFELMPLALYLWQSGQARTWLDLLARSGPAEPCVFYNSDPAVPSGCRFHAWRPLSCRLFGFSAARNKHSQPLLSLCQVLKQQNPEAPKQLQAKLDRGDLPTPVNSDYAHQISGLNPHLGRDRYPINEALQRALERTGFRLALAGGSSGLPRRPTAA